MCRSTIASSAAARDDSSSSACGRRQPRQPRQLGHVRRGPPGQRRQLTGVAVAAVVGSPAKTNRPPGLSTRTTSRSDSSTSGMWCSTAWPTTRSKVSSSYGMPSASATRPSIVEAEVLAVAGGDLDHARRQVRHRSAPGDTRLDQVEQEEPAAAAQLQRPVVRQLALLGERHRRVEQVAGVVDTALVVGDRPLVVVALGFPVVVQHLGQLGVVAGRLDLFGGGVRIGHRSRPGGDIRLGSSRLSGSATSETVSVSSKLITGQPKGQTSPWPRPVPAAGARRTVAPRPARRRTRRRAPPSRRSGPARTPPWRR